MKARAHIKLVKRSVIYQGHIIRLVKDVLDVDGRRMIREVGLHPGAAVVVPVLGKDRILLVRQYRRAVGRWLLELPAGTLHPGEPPLRCARRELEEETGWRARRWRRLGRFYAAPGLLSEQMTMFLAQDLVPGRMQLDHDEMLTPVALSFKEALHKVRTGSICDAKTLIGLWWASQFLISRESELSR